MSENSTTGMSINLILDNCVRKILYFLHLYRFGCILSHLVRKSCITRNILMALAFATNLRVYDDNWGIVRPPDDVRHRALTRLYEHKSAVDNLISALERYQREQGRLCLL